MESAVCCGLSVFICNVGGQDMGDRAKWNSDCYCRVRVGWLLLQTLKHGPAVSGQFPNVGPRGWWHAFSFSLGKGRSRFGPFLWRKLYPSPTQLEEWVDEGW